MNRTEHASHLLGRILGALLLTAAVYLSGVLWYDAEGPVEHLLFFGLGVLAGVLFFLFGGDLLEWLWWWT